MECCLRLSDRLDQYRAERFGASPEPYLQVPRQCLFRCAEGSAYGAGGALTKSLYSGPGVGGTIVYFMVEDCATQQDRAAEAGGIVIKPKFSIGEYGSVVLRQDTEGNMFGFHSMQSATPALN